MRGVLTYHAIDRSTSPLSVPPESFRRHVEWLATGKVQVVSLAELLSLPTTANAVALTFDDALASVATEAAPLLSAHGFPATVFVVTGHVGRDNRWNGRGDPGIPVHGVLGWPALERLRALGISIGAHTRHHPRLTRCTDTELRDEIDGSADDIERALGERAATFAYPYGDHDDRVAAASRQVFTVSCTTKFSPVTVSTATDRVPRLDAWYFRNPARLERWGSPGFHRSVAMRRTLRRARRIFG